MRQSRRRFVAKFKSFYKKNHFYYETMLMNKIFFCDFLLFILNYIAYHNTGILKMFQVLHPPMESDFARITNFTSL